MPASISPTWLRSTRCAAAVLARFGRVDVLVNAAGWDRIQPFLENTPDFMDRILAINLRGPIGLTQKLLPAMAANGYGKIVNVSSDAGRVGSLGETVYAAAKGGMIAFTKSLAREIGALQHQRELRLPRSDGHAPVPRPAGEAEGGAGEGDPVQRIAKPQELSRRHLVLCQPALGLRDRPGVERQRWADDGWIRRKRRVILAHYPLGIYGFVLCVKMVCPCPARHQASKRYLPR